jgi:predicted esterase
MTWLMSLVLSQLCPAGWAATSSTEACVLEGKGPGVVVYLHGMLAPPEKGASSSRPFARELGFITPAARRGDATVVVLKGTAGLCDWAPEFETWWCWPSVKSRRAELDALASRIDGVLDELEVTLARRLPAPLVVGYSNGGYATSLLMESQLGVTGFVVLHGGLVTGVAVPERPKPTLLIAAEGDTIQRPAMESFRRALEQRGWSPAFVLRKKEHPLELEDFEHVTAFAKRLTWKPRAPRPQP